MAWRRFRKKKELPSGLWIKCPNCEETQFKKELRRNLDVCTECGHHFPLSAPDRVLHLIDQDTFEEYCPDLYTIDRLKFVDREPYSAKIRRSVQKTGRAEAVVYGLATIEGQPCILCVMDFTFIGGSMGSVVGEKVTRAIELATERGLPVIVVSASGGARMHEGALSLMQMGKTCAALQRHDAKGGLFISVLTNPTTGGVMASFAALGDVILAEPGALIGFAGPRVIQETLRQQLPEGFQRSEFLLDHGFLDQLVSRHELRSMLSRILGYLGNYTPDQLTAPDNWQAPEDWDLPDEPESIQEAPTADSQATASEPADPETPESDSEFSLKEKEAT